MDVGYYKHPIFQKANLSSTHLSVRIAQLTHLNEGYGSSLVVSALEKKTNMNEIETKVGPSLKELYLQVFLLYQVYPNQRKTRPSHCSGRRDLRLVAHHHQVNLPVRTDHVDRSPGGQLQNRGERVNLRPLRV